MLPANASCWWSTSLSTTTMAASSLSGPTVFSTSAWATVAARAIRKATDRTSRRCTAGLILPIMEYAHNASGGEAIIGGFVYRGSAIAGLAGAYVFGDLSSGHIWAGVQDSSGNWSQTLVLNHNLTVSSFGQDPAFE